MYKYSRQSLKNLSGVHPVLREFCDELLRYHDFKVVSGLRTVEEQSKLVASGASKTMDSKHLAQLDGWSHAVDLWPIVDRMFLDDKNPEHVKQWAYFLGLADMLGTKMVFNQQTDMRIVLGADWNHNRNFIDNGFDDWFHFEMRGIE